MKAAMYAIIKKDFRIVASNRRLFPALFIVPLVLTIVLPSMKFFGRCNISRTFGFYNCIAVYFCHYHSFCTG